MFVDPGGSSKEATRGDGGEDGADGSAEDRGRAAEDGGRKSDEDGPDVPVHAEFCFEHGSIFVTPPMLFPPPQPPTTIPLSHLTHCA